MYQILLGVAIAMESRMQFRVVCTSQRECEKCQSIQGGVNFENFLVGC